MTHATSLIVQGSNLGSHRLDLTHKRRKWQSTLDRQGDLGSYDHGSRSSGMLGIGEQF